MREARAAAQAGRTLIALVQPQWHTAEAAGVGEVRERTQAGPALVPEANPIAYQMALEQARAMAAIGTVGSAPPSGALPTSPARWAM